MSSIQTINDLMTVVNSLDTRIDKNKDSINSKELEYMAYQRIKILQLIDDLHSKESYFKNT